MIMFQVWDGVKNCSSSRQGNWDVSSTVAAESTVVRLRIQGENLVVPSQLGLNSALLSESST
jgi:hypothetical protein